MTDRTQHLLSQALSIYRRTTQVLGEIAISLWTIRIPLMTAAVCVVALAVPDHLLSTQLVEAIQSIIENTVDTSWLPWLSIAVTTAGLAVSLFYCACVALALEAQRSAPRSAFGIGLQTHLPAGLAMSPFISVSMACYGAASSNGSNTAISVPLNVIAAVMMFWGCAVVAIAHRSGTTSVHVRMPRIARYVLSIGTAVCISGILVASSTAVQYTTMIGPIPILLSALAGWTCVATVILVVARRSRLPVLGMLCLAAMLFALLDINDNHEVRTVRPVVERNGSAVMVERNLPRDYDLSDRLGSLQAWLTRRRDLELYQGASYPIVVVSTEGGGIRAAYLTAYVLAAIQDRCPGFAEHVFAISSVSGGSLGAAVFAGLVAQSESFGSNDPCAISASLTPTFVEAADRVLRHDFFTPVLTGFLFSDLFQVFLPFPIRSFDRAVALEQSFEAAWGDATTGHEFEEPFYGLWTHASDDRSVPPLLLNVTVVETGKRVVITPHRLSLGLPRLNPSIRLSTAVGLSSRFPFVTPAGWIKYFDSGIAERWYPWSLSDKVRLVDGGYYENSGAASLVDLVTGIQSDHEFLRESAQRPPSLWGGNPSQLLARIPQYHFLVVRISTLTGREAFPGQGLGELLSPARTLVNTRNARTADATRSLNLAANGWRDPNTQWANYPFDFVLCPDQQNPVPLGWMLSERARSSMRSQTHSPVTCDQPWGTDKVSNAKTMRELVKSLQPRS